MQQHLAFVGDGEAGVRTAAARDGPAASSRTAATDRHASSSNRSIRRLDSGARWAVMLPTTLSMAALSNTLSGSGRSGRRAARAAPTRRLTPQITLRTSLRSSAVR